MRRPVKNRNIVKPDYKYNSVRVGRLINYVMWEGKKELATRLVYKTLDIIKEKTSSENPVDILDLAIKNAGPVAEVRSRRIGGANYQVPREVRPERRVQLAFKWMIEAARAKGGNAFEERLASEIIAASNNEGEAVRKKENTHKMAEANKAFAHFSW